MGVQDNATLRQPHASRAVTCPNFVHVLAAPWHPSPCHQNELLLCDRPCRAGSTACPLHPGYCPPVLAVSRSALTRPAIRPVPSSAFPTTGRRITNMASTATASIYDTITNQIIAALERSASDYTLPWHRSSAPLTRPINAVTQGLTRRQCPCPLGQRRGAGLRAPSLGRVRRSPRLCLATSHISALIGALVSVARLSR